MRVLLASRGSRGDIEPLAGLAARLTAKGADVTIAAPPDREFTDLANRAGARHMPVDAPIRQMVQAIAKGTGPSMHQHIREILASHGPAFTAVAEEGCDAIIATGLFPVVATAQAIAERYDIPFASAALQPTTLPSHTQRPFPMPGWPLPEGLDNRELWEWDKRKMQATFGEPVNAYRESIGLPPTDDIRTRTLTDHRWLATDPVLSPWEPTDLIEVVQTGAWMLPDERPLPADLEVFLDAGDAPVYIGFGSIPVRDAEDAARAVVESVRAHGRRAVLSRGWAGLAPIDDADDCFVIDEVNQQALFPRAAAIVHHGGAGTTHTATRSGTPQVVVPQIVDQPYWAGRVAELGIGAHHDGPVPTTETLTAALGIALAPEARARAAEVGPLVRTDGADIAADLVLDMAG
ncbi:glycosyltransferase [Glycomyces tritici]|uniref:Glycosyltransferase n=1 Tax=Glycomyces tritici TaxID=2665176 RepID=A0ABT7YX12_9ACTN|nr:glycosyltransferase [Glycomyces tritici]MDN3243165.1 glycosyltransferase [Glycomyces tritici]